MRKALLAVVIIVVLGALALVFWPREVERDREVAPAGTASMLVPEEPRSQPGARTTEPPDAKRPAGPAESNPPAETALAALPDEADAPASGQRDLPASDGDPRGAQTGRAPAAEATSPLGAAEELAALSPATGELGQESAAPASTDPGDAEVEGADAPALDLVRVSPDGQAVIAGRARPRQQVKILLEGEILAEVEADASGAFVAVTHAPPSSEPREMVLRVVRDPAGDDPAAAPVAGSAPVGGPSAPRAESADLDYAFSAPVVVLPSADPAEAPVLVSRGEKTLDVVQPGVPEAVDRMALDRITYRAGGDVIAAGRGPEASAVRAYANGELVAEAAIGEDGGWQAIIPHQVAQQTQLLRFDEVSASGDVLTRLEAPFVYASDGADQELRQQAVTIERGNSLWRIAEEHYGEGLRYSVIYSANAELIRDPNLIYPGQVLTVPELVETE